MNLTVTYFEVGGLSPTVIVGAGPCARPRKPKTRPSFRHSRGSGNPHAPHFVIPAEAGIHTPLISSFPRKRESTLQSSTVFVEPALDPDQGDNLRCTEKGGHIYNGTKSLGVSNEEKKNL